MIDGGPSGPEVDELGVWSWCRWYSPVQMATGLLGWRLLMTHGDRLVSSRGYGAFPPAGVGEPAALERLLGSLRTLTDADPATPE